MDYSKYEDGLESFRHLKYFHVSKTTSNSRVYKIAKKLSMEINSEIHCGLCPYHKNENWRNKGFDNKCWKTYRKTQYWRLKGISEYD